MKQRTPVSKIMTASPISVNLTNDLNDVQAIFDEHGFHHVPVVSGEKIIGLISRTDIERISYVSQVSTDQVDTMVNSALSIEQVMTSTLKTIQQSDTIKDAAEILSVGDIHALPVLDGEKVVGIVTTTDMLRYLLAQY